MSGWRTLSLLALHPLYLDAYCLRRRATLTFCLARILAVESAPIGGLGWGEPRRPFHLLPSPHPESASGERATSWRVCSMLSTE